MEIRKEVKKFAEGMENKLRKNDHKKHWLNDGIYRLYGKLCLEVRELTDELSKSTLSKEDVISECYDISNYAMMIADSIEKGKE